LATLHHSGTNDDGATFRNAYSCGQQQQQQQHRWCGEFMNPCHTVKTDAAVFKAASVMKESENNRLFLVVFQSAASSV
jgi:hypothetical protein